MSSCPAPGRKSISKEELSELEAEVIPLPIVLLDSTSSDDEIRETMSRLSQEPVLGLDTETKPSFQKGTNNPVSILQLSGHRFSVIVRLLSFDPETKEERLEPVARLLADPEILLVGVSIRDDALELLRDHGLLCTSVLELQTVAKRAGIKVMSLSKLYALLYRKRISKSQRLSNWENDPLTEAQQQYAALDAYAGLRIYEGLQSHVLPSMIEGAVRPTPPPQPRRRKREDKKGRKKKRLELSMPSGLKRLLRPSKRIKKDNNQTRKK